MSLHRTIRAPPSEVQACRSIGCKRTNLNAFGTGVEQVVHPFAGGHFAFAVFLVNLLLAAAEVDLLEFATQVGEQVLHLVLVLVEGEVLLRIAHVGVLGGAKVPKPEGCGQKKRPNESSAVAPACVTNGDFREAAG